MPKFYFNFKKERENLAKNQTNFTSAVTLIIGLNEASRCSRRKGSRTSSRAMRRLPQATRAKRGGDRPQASIPRNSPSNCVTAIEAPQGVDGQAIYKNLREKYGITGAGGQDQAKGKIFRIAHLGYADTFDVITAIAAIEMVLKDLGYPVKLGTGVGVAQELLMK